jgi:hypothetical protein
MTPRVLKARWFAGGFVCAAALFALATFVYSGLRHAAIVSKSKHLLGNALYLDKTVQSYRAANHGKLPPSKAEVVRQLGARAWDDFDYFREADGYTLVYPSLTGKLRWEPYVFRNGRLAAFPLYMRAEIAGLMKGGPMRR